MHTSKRHDKKSQRRQKTTRLHQLKRRSVSLVRSERVKRSIARCTRSPATTGSTNRLASFANKRCTSLLSIAPTVSGSSFPAPTPALFQSIVLSLYELICGTAGCLYRRRSFRAIPAADPETMSGIWSASMGVFVASVSIG